MRGRLYSHLMGCSMDDPHCASFLKHKHRKKSHKNRFHDHSSNRCKVDGFSVTEKMKPLDRWSRARF